MKTDGPIKGSKRRSLVAAMDKEADLIKGLNDCVTENSTIFMVVIKFNNQVMTGYHISSLTVQLRATKANLVDYLDI